jgi:hypothetical protein
VAGFFFYDATSSFRFLNDLNRVDDPEVWPAVNPHLDERDRIFAADFEMRQK